MEVRPRRLVQIILVLLPAIGNSQPLIVKHLKKVSATKKAALKRKFNPAGTSQEICMRCPTILSSLICTQLLMVRSRHGSSRPMVSCTQQKPSTPSELRKTWSHRNLMNTTQPHLQTHTNTRTPWLLICIHQSLSPTQAITAATASTRKV